MAATAATSGLVERPVTTLNESKDDYIHDEDIRSAGSSNSTASDCSDNSIPQIRNPYSPPISARPLPFPPRKMPAPNVPKPGPAKLSKNAGLEEWLEEAKQCHYLPEVVMKQLCEMVKECLMEGALHCLSFLCTSY